MCLRVKQCPNRVLDSLQLALVVHAVYYYAVLNFFNPIALLAPVWSILVCYTSFYLAMIKELTRFPGNSPK